MPHSGLFLLPRPMYYNLTMSDYLNQIAPEVQQLLVTIRQAGGRPMLVGGTTLDVINGKHPRDWDIEVFGLPYNDLERVLRKAGYPTDTGGRRLGILQTKVGHHDIDLTIPRRENDVDIWSPKYKAVLAPNLNAREAALTRDVTINTIYLDPIEGKIVDPYGGLKDYRRGIIRAVNPRTFPNDPIRTLRVMQLVARKGKKVDPNTIRLARQTAGRYSEIPVDQILGEWEKLLRYSKRPSVGIRFLQQAGWGQAFPEIQMSDEDLERLDRSKRVRQALYRRLQTRLSQ